MHISVSRVISEQKSNHSMVVIMLSPLLFQCNCTSSCKCSMIPLLHHQMSLPSCARSTLMDAILQLISFKLTSKKMSNPFFINIENQKTSESPKEKTALQSPSFFLHETKNISNAYSNNTKNGNSIQKVCGVLEFISYAYFSYYFSCSVYLELQL